MIHFKMERVTYRRNSRSENFLKIIKAKLYLQSKGKLNPLLFLMFSCLASSVDQTVKSLVQGSVFSGSPSDLQSAL